MACSRMPKCSVRPYWSPANSCVERSAGRKDGSPFIVVLFEPARSAEPPHSSGSTGASALSTSPEAARVATRLARREHGQRRPSSRRAARRRRAGRAGRRSPGWRRATRRTRSATRPSPAALRSESRAGVREDLGGDLEGLLGVEAEQLLEAADLVAAELGAVRRVVFGLGRRGPRDERAQADERRAVGVGLGGLDRGVQGVDVLAVAVRAAGPVDELHVPAVRLVAREDVLGERDLGVALDRDVVVVPQHDEVAQLLRARRATTPRWSRPPAGRRRRR